MKSDVEKFRRNEGAKKFTFLGSVTARKIRPTRVVLLLVVIGHGTEVIAHPVTECIPSVRPVVHVDPSLQ